MNARVRLSVIMPVLNGERHISEAMNCFLCSLGSDDELIVINDGSCDSTSKIIESFAPLLPNMQCVDTERIGPAGARNAGLALAKGSYISFLDHDDLWPSGRVDRHIALLEMHPEISVVVGKTSYEYNKSIAGQKMLFKHATTAIHHVHLGAATFRAEVFKQIGIFNGSLKFSEDHDLFFRIREAAYQLYFESDVALRYRVHGANMSLGKSLKEVGFFQILKDSIKRRREQGIFYDLPKFGVSQNEK